MYFFFAFETNPKDDYQLGMRIEAVVMYDVSLKDEAKVSLLLSHPVK
jgi:hypothetical protein